MLVKENLQESCQEAKLRSLDAEIFGFFELVIPDKDLDGWFISLLLDQKNDLLLSEP